MRESQHKVSQDEKKQGDVVQSKEQNKSPEINSKERGTWTTWQRIQNNCYQDIQWAQKNNVWTKWEYQPREILKRTKQKESVTSKTGHLKLPIRGRKRKKNEKEWSTPKALMGYHKADHYTHYRSPRTRRREKGAESSFE